MIPAIVIGRKGSKGFPGKNFHPILGKPLCWYPMNAALQSRFVNQVFLSTNDPKLVNIAKPLGLKIIDRPANLCTDKALGEDVFKHGFEEIKKVEFPARVEMIVLLFCNAPMATAKAIDAGIRFLRKNPNLDSAVTVSKYNMWSPLRARKIARNHCLKPFIPFQAFGDPRKLTCDRDSQGDVWFADMSVSVVRPRCLERIEEGLLPQKWMGKKIFPIKQEGGLDVDYAWQIPYVVDWIRRYKKIN